MDKIKRGLKYLAKPKNLIIEAIVLIALVGIIITSYFMITSVNKCDDSACFSQALVSCDKVSFVADKTESIFYYQILGQKDNACQVNVRLLQIKQGTSELDKLRNKEMICVLPLGSYSVPEENIQRCHGELREQIQEIMIQRMHSELVENLGSIKDELTKVL